MLLLVLSTLIGTAGAEAPPSLDGDFIRYDELPAPPPAEESAPWNVVDLDDLVLVRPSVQALQEGFDYDAFTRAILAATRDREREYDVAVIVHSDALPTQFTGAAAFHLAYNNADVTGTGQDPVLHPEIPVRSGLWMNGVDYWDLWPTESVGWVFCHEVGHQWLAFARFDDGAGPSTQLLGRQTAHWSYFVATDNSPMEGNAWIDNGDGSFTTDLDSGGSFNSLDLYLMGLIPAEEAGPIWRIVADGAVERTATSSPEHLWGDEPVTVHGTRVEADIDDIIAGSGVRRTDSDFTAAELQMLYIFVAAPHEVLDPADIDRALERRSSWLSAWDSCTGGRSDLSLGVQDEGWGLPEPPDGPALVPGGAW